MCVCVCVCVCVQMISVKSCFIRGSVVRYVQLPPGELDPDVLQDSTRTEVAKEQASK